MTGGRSWSHGISSAILPITGSVDVWRSGHRRLRVELMVQAARAAAEGRTVITFDVSQAFLNANVDDDQTYIRLPKRVSEILCLFTQSIKNLYVRMVQLL